LAQQHQLFAGCDGRVSRPWRQSLHVRDAVPLLVSLFGRVGVQGSRSGRIGASRLQHQLRL
jgi:hypothetical protein